MRCFRLSHAGLVVENDGRSLFIDPGDFSNGRELTAAIAAADPIAAIVITHEHADHWTPENIAELRIAAPDAPLYTTATTATALAEAGIDDAVVVREGDGVSMAGFFLEFYGRRHEQLHSSLPIVDNIGVRVNGTLAWGGDSLTRPPFVSDVLGVPVGSPWSNLAQVMDFVLNAAPRRAFLTHDGMLSTRGLGMYATRVQWCLDQHGGELITIPRLDDDAAARVEIEERFAVQPIAPATRPAR